MPKYAYRTIKIGEGRLALIEKANEILDEYKQQGFQLTLRQLYYQFVSRDLIPNNQKSYSLLGDIISDARLAGLVDWNHIVDRTRAVERRPSWDSPKDIVDAIVQQYHEDLWATQPHRVEVWIEKDALVGVIEPVCRELDVPYLSCRGYTSQSEMWGAGQRLIGYRKQRQTPVIFHLGDHDPSGKDMTRDISDRLEMFTGKAVSVFRLALNKDQIDQYDPPPNPAKLTDARAAKYIAEFGESSWELDALEPSVIATLIRDAVDTVRDLSRWEQAIKKQEEGRKRLKQVAKTLD